MEKRKRRARIFALGFAAMFMLAAVIVGVTLSVRNQSSVEGATTTNPVMEWSHMNVALSPSPLSLVVHATISGPTSGFPSGGITVSNPSASMNHSGGGQASISVHGTVLLPSLPTGFTWDAGPSVVFSGTITAFWNPSGGTWHGDWDIGTRTFSGTPNVTATLPFHASNTGAFLGNVSVTAQPHTNQTFLLPSFSFGTVVPPTDHEFAGFSGNPVVRNIGNGGTLARQYITPIFIRIQRQITWNPNGGTWTTAPPSGVSGGSLGSTANRTSNEGQGLTPAATRPGILYRTNYEFIGWSPSGAIPASNQTRTAIWEPLAPTIHLATFNLHGGRIGNHDQPYEDMPHIGAYTMPIVDGMRTPRPRDPVRLGYIFTGWFTTYDGDEEFNFITPRTSNQTIHANWEPITGNVVILHLAGGLSHNETVWYFNTSRPYTLRLPGADIMNQNSPVSGQVFLGWFDNVERVGVPVVLIPGDASGPQLLFALWG